jgi:hypothetical protein
VIVLDPGHKYRLDNLDGDGEVELTFVKRMGDNYPGNTSAYEGTTTQEVLRALIERTKYVNAQIPCQANEDAIRAMRIIIEDFEARAAVRHGMLLDLPEDVDVETLEPDYTGHLTQYWVAPLII